MEIERRIVERPVEVRAAADGSVVIVQRAVPYGELTVDMGGWRETIMAGAFSLEGKDIRSLWQHDARLVLGRTAAGTLRLWEQEDGIYAESNPPDTTWARDALASIRRGDISSSSFAFYVDEEEWTMAGDMPLRMVKRARLEEVSVVTWAAYPQTTASVQQRAQALRARGDDAVSIEQAEELTRAREALRLRVDVRRARSETGPSRQS